MNKKISLLVIISLILGLVSGYIFPNTMNHLSFIGSIYIDLLKLLITPLLFTNIIVSLYHSQNNHLKIFISILLTFIIMFILTFLITSFIVAIFKLGYGYHYPSLLYHGQIPELKLKQIIINLFPSSIKDLLFGHSIFLVFILAIILGICATKIPHSKKIIKIIETLKDILIQIFDLIMSLTPIGVFFLIGSLTANYGTTILHIGTNYILLSYLCGILIMFLIMILPVWLIAKINPITYIKKIYQVWLISLSTCSSVATLPVTIKVCQEKFNLPSKLTNLVVPLGCTINMCGGAVSFALLAIFSSQLYGVHIDLSTYLLMIISATLINMAAPGIPNGGIALGASYLTILNIPTAFIGFYSGIYRLLDMNYTTLNVTGDVTASILINHYLSHHK